ncbi:MAG: GTPase, partial [Promethearchaeota archaeon]
LATINDKLKKIAHEQALKKKKRVHEGFIELTLAGYTNAGKSTLHRALTGSTVKVADELFTTLATKASELDMPGRRVVLSDSVGFISDLPDPLIQAFNTTLMEVADADVIILVVDASDSTDEMERKVDACLETFNEIGANGIPMITALNKIDLLDQSDIADRVDHLPESCSVVTPISAERRINLDKLMIAVEKELPRLQRYQIVLPYGNEGMSVLSWLYDNGDVESEEYAGTDIKVIVSLSIEIAEKFKRANPDNEISKLDG